MDVYVNIYIVHAHTYNILVEVVAAYEDFLKVRNLSLVTHLELHSINQSLYISFFHKHICYEHNSLILWLYLTLMKKQNANICLRSVKSLGLDGYRKSKFQDLGCGCQLIL